MPLIRSFRVVGAMAEEAGKKEEQERRPVAPGAEEEDEDDDKFNPGKQMSLQEQLEMDKEDESLRKWKEQLLGNLSLQDGKTEPEVHFLAMRVLVEGRDPLDLPLEAVEASKKAKEQGKEKPALHFVLKEKSEYRIQFEFAVKNELVLGLTYLNRVFRMGVPVDKTKIMLGTYGPQQEPYKFETEAETTPDGMLARGKYTAKTSFVDDDGRNYLEFDYTFEIKKEW